MAWEEHLAEEEREAQQEAMRLFSEQTACKLAGAEELRQKALYNQMEMKLLAEELRADYALAEAQRMAEELSQKQEMALAVASAPKRSRGGKWASRFSSGGRSHTHRVRSVSA